eukprot:COSAG04_NODE_3138_length_3129_cov_2.708581_3_plen_119_part_00
MASALLGEDWQAEMVSRGETQSFVDPRSKKGPVVYVPSPHSLPSSLTLSLNHLPAAGRPGRTTAIIAGVQGVKRTSELIPFCHPLPVTPSPFPPCPFRALTLSCAVGGTGSCTTAAWK